MISPLISSVGAAADAVLSRGLECCWRRYDCHAHHSGLAWLENACVHGRRRERRIRGVRLGPHMEPFSAPVTLIWNVLPTCPCKLARLPGSGSTVLDQVDKEIRKKYRIPRER
jgi:hypothetical protein